MKVIIKKRNKQKKIVLIFRLFGVHKLTESVTTAVNVTKRDANDVDKNTSDQNYSSPIPDENL